MCASLVPIGSLKLSFLSIDQKVDWCTHGFKPRTSQQRYCRNIINDEDENLYCNSEIKTSALSLVDYNQHYNIKS